ncbi:MAG: DUF2892 domain-containing protein [Halobacteriales archaeon]|nr:DUF2892 domain-containing protein [Halobacteriales archaeon]
MKKNVGGLDRTGRLVIGTIFGIAGAVVLSGYIALGDTIGLMGIIVGVVLLITGTTQRCPVNSVAGLDSTKPDR